MFARLMFVRTAEAMVDVVLEGLFPSAYLEDFSDGVCNRERLHKVGHTIILVWVESLTPSRQDFLRRYSLTRKQSLAGNFLQTLAAV